MTAKTMFHYMAGHRWRTANGVVLKSKVELHRDVKTNLSALMFVLDLYIKCFIAVPSLGRRHRKEKVIQSQNHDVKAFGRSCLTPVIVYSRFRVKENRSNSKSNCELRCEERRRLPVDIFDENGQITDN